MFVTELNEFLNMFPAANLFSLLSHMQKRLYKMYEKSFSHFRRIKCQQVFLARCLDEHVMPKSIDFQTFSNEKPFHDAKALVLKDRIYNARVEAEQAAYASRVSYSRLHSEMRGSDLFIELSRLANIRVRRNEIIHKHVLEQKLSRLCDNTIWNQVSTVDSVVDLTSQGLTCEQVVALGLGLSFNQPSTNRDMINAVAQFDYFSYRYCNQVAQLDNLKGLIPVLLHSMKCEMPYLPLRYRTAITELAGAVNIRILPADKGGKVVAMDNSAYLEKANSLLSDTVTYRALLSNPVERVRREFKKNLLTLIASCPDAQICEQLMPRTSNLSYFHAIPKIHKDNIPLRPIVSNIGSVNRPLSKWISKYTSPYIGTFSPSHIRNSLEFTSKLSELSGEVDVTRLKMVSFDVASLFTNVPVEEVLDFLVRKSDEGLFNTPVPIGIFMDMVRLCVGSNFFEFEGRYFEQIFGVAMGNPISPILANLFMEYFETELLPSLSTRPKYWFRYIDDVFALVDEEFEIGSFLEELNALRPTIKFTAEYEINGKLPFLDTLVHRTGNIFKFSIYRKPTHSNMYLHYFS